MSSSHVIFSTWRIDTPSASRTSTLRNVKGTHPPVTTFGRALVGHSIVSIEILPRIFSLSMSSIVEASSGPWNRTRRNTTAPPRSSSRVSALSTSQRRTLLGRVLTRDPHATMGVVGIHGGSYTVQDGTIREEIHVI